MKKIKTLQDFDDALWLMEMDAKVMSSCLRSHRADVYAQTKKLRSFASKFIPAHQKLLRENALLKKKVLKGATQKEEESQCVR